jgi:biopolymer transport protein ExbD
MASAKLAATTQVELEDMEMDISSMIDLVFLLLIFFMVSSHLIIIQIDEEVRPPVATAGKAVENAMGRIVVNIRADGSVYDTVPRLMAGPDADLGEVEAYIGELADSYTQGSIQPRLHVRADKDVDVRRIKEVVQAAARSNVIDVIFAAYVSEGAASMAP